ncbi:MAG: 30S ribosomal protein S20 [Proteobacteria bacterium]|jgi:small subunit ribosomal protein S20|nr:30S ribosomal protein S20 [Pseudomonadota bacterium]
MATSKAAAKKSKSDLKRKRQAVKRHARNSSILSRLKTEEKKLRSALQEGVTDVKALYSAFASALDKAAKSGAVHKNVASRKKSRLNTRVAGGNKTAAEAKPKKSGGAKAAATKTRSKAAKAAKKK